MKPVLLAAALLMLPAAVQAQVAAGTVPNTFDRPAAPTPPARPRAQPAAPAAPAAAGAAAPANAQSQETLLALIAAAQAGRIDYSIMTDTLAAEVRPQEATIQPLIKGFGAVETVQFMTSLEGADVFVITFENALTEWRIGFDDAGKIDALLFRPAP